MSGYTVETISALPTSPQANAGDVGAFTQNPGESGVEQTVRLSIAQITSAGWAIANVAPSNLWGGGTADTVVSVVIDSGIFDYTTTPSPSLSLNQPEGVAGNWSKVQVNQYGQVIVGAQISSTDIDTALGGTPLLASAAGTTVAPLNSNGQIPAEFISGVIASGVSYAGTWNAATNTPELASGEGSNGELFVVSAAGTTDLDGNATWNVGDQALYSGHAWERIPTGGVGLQSVNGISGTAITLTVANIPGAAPLASPVFTNPTANTPSAFAVGQEMTTAAWVLAKSYLTTNQTITVSGDVSGSGSTAIMLSLPSIVTPGTATKVTYNAKGQVIGGTALTSTDVTNALGFTPSNVASGTSTDTGGTLVQRDSSSNFAAGTITASLAGNATSATSAVTAGSLAVARSITISGAVSGSVTFDGSANVTISTALPSIVAAGTGSKLTVNAQGMVTAIANLGSADVTTALGYSPISSTSPVFTNATGNTPATNDNSTAFATTAWFRLQPTPALGALTGVTLTSPATQDLLMFSGAAWVNYPAQTLLDGGYI